MSSQQQERLRAVNEAIQVIARHGRRFFFCQKANTHAVFEIDPKGVVWYVDENSGLSIRIDASNKTRHWVGFSHGGTLRDLVERFYEYIVTGRLVSRFYLGPERYDGSNIWGYPEHDIQLVRQEAGRLALFHQAEIHGDAAATQESVQ